MAAIAVSMHYSKVNNRIKSKQQFHIREERNASYVISMTDNEDSLRENETVAVEKYW